MNQTSWLWAQKLGSMCLDFLLPPRCLVCGVCVAMPGVLCSTCWENVSFLAPPWCERCGAPFELGRGEGARKEEYLCPSCLVAPPPWQRGRSAFLYEESGKALVLKFKHGDRTDLTHVFAEWLKRVGSELLAEADLIVPVPLHRWRLFFRLYNQSALLSLSLGKKAQVPVAPRALERIRSTVSQGHLGRAARARNVRGAFCLSRTGQTLVENKRVLLIDDVLTSGATLSACTRTLLAGGARSVDVLTLARVLNREVK